ncbi:MAG: nicotinate-nucleotide adenylyltransferase [Chloroflexota bacterium]
MREAEGAMHGQGNEQEGVRRLGVIGGSFDPIHIAHLVMADTVREALGLDRVLFMPAGQQPLKRGKPASPAEQRAAMVQLAIEGDPYFVLSRVDLDRAGPSYTADSMERLREEWGGPDQVAMWFITGTDSLLTMPQWREPGRILAHTRLAVIQRPNFNAEGMGTMDALEAQVPGIKAAIDWVDAPLMEISSTDIRERVRAGRSIRYRTPEAVRDYIEAQGLYR